MLPVTPNIIAGVPSLIASHPATPLTVATTLDFALKTIVSVSAGTHDTLGSSLIR